MAGLDSETQLSHLRGTRAPTYPPSQSSWPQSSVSSGRGRSASPASSIDLEPFNQAGDFGGESGTDTYVFVLKMLQLFI